LDGCAVLEESGGRTHDRSLRMGVIQRSVMAQDTGGAIVGAVRADLFTG
jgi:membrane-bound lytic murein transglycosylase